MLNVSNSAELDSLFGEKSLLAIYKTAPPFKSNGFNKWVAIATSLLLLVLCAAHIISPNLRDQFIFPFADTFSAWASAGATLAGTILGFLIAGFAILCTILRPQTMIALLKIKREKYQLTELKLLFVSFVDVMVQYLALLFWSLFVLVGGGRAGPAAILGRYLSSIHWMVPFVLLHLIFAVWGTWLIVVVLTLKSFVYNLYQGLLLGVADAVDDYERQKLCESQRLGDQGK